VEASSGEKPWVKPCAGSCTKRWGSPLTQTHRTFGSKEVIDPGHPDDFAQPVRAARRSVPHVRVKVDAR
jgi:hypothetical protein